MLLKYYFNTIEVVVIHSNVVVFCKYFNPINSTYTQCGLINPIHISSILLIILYKHATNTIS
jgi:hypothetical protein